MTTTNGTPAATPGAPAGAGRRVSHIPSLQERLEAAQEAHHPRSRRPYVAGPDTYRCIAFDGGPNTLTYLRCLVELERLVPGFVDRTQLFAGTSDGAFAATYLASCETIGIAELEACIEMIEAILSDAIAPNRFPLVRDGVAALAGRLGVGDPTEVAASLDAPLRSISSITGAARLVSGLSTWADHAGMRRVLRAKIDPAGTLTMGELPRDLVIVSYSLHAPTQAPLDAERSGEPRRRAQRPKVYQNIDRNDGDCRQSVIDVALRSAALPLFMPIHDRHIDGAIFANNPAMCAVAAAVANRRGSDGRLWYLKDLLLLSMGSDDGTFGSEVIEHEMEGSHEHRWGWAKWTMHGALRGMQDLMLIMDVVLNSDSAGVNYQTAQLLGRRFLRIAPPGKTRSVDKFMGVVLGQVSELKQMAIDTARSWAAEYEATKGWDRVSAASATGAADAEDEDERVRRAVLEHRTQQAMWGGLGGGVVGQYNAGVGQQAKPSLAAQVALQNTRSLREAVRWAHRGWMEGVVGR